MLAARGESAAHVKADKRPIVIVGAAADNTVYRFAVAEHSQIGGSRVPAAAARPARYAGAWRLAHAPFGTHYASRPAACSLRSARGRAVWIVFCGSMYAEGLPCCSVF